jgi:RNA polymerase sigma-70 factor (ECF subfamily)
VATVSIESPDASPGGAPGDRQSLFDHAREHHIALINRIALSYEIDPTLRRELVQDIMLALWMALANFRGESTLRTFVASVAQKRSISHVTRRAREPRQEELSPDLPSSGPRPDEIAVQNDMKQRLVESIQKLPIPQREAIVLTLEEFSYAEIGEVLGITSNAAMLRCQRARAALKAIMEARS